MRVEVQRAPEDPPLHRGAVEGLDPAVATEDIGVHDARERGRDWTSQDELGGQCRHLLSVGTDREALEGSREVPPDERALADLAHERRVTALRHHGHLAHQLTRAPVLELPIRELGAVRTADGGEEEPVQALADVLHRVARGADREVDAAEDVRAAGERLDLLPGTSGLVLELGGRHDRLLEPEHRLQVREARGVVDLLGLVEAIRPVRINHVALHPGGRDATAVPVEEERDDLLEPDQLAAGEDVLDGLDAAAGSDERGPLAGVHALDEIEITTHESLLSGSRRPEKHCTPVLGVGGLSRDERRFCPITHVIVQKLLSFFSYYS